MANPLYDGVMAVNGGSTTTTIPNSPAVAPQYPTPTNQAPDVVYNTSAFVEVNGGGGCIQVKTKDQQHTISV